jgi:hypothetical protein
MQSQTHADRYQGVARYNTCGPQHTELLMRGHRADRLEKRCTIRKPALG